MSDTRAAIRELRSLGEKRSTQGLTDQEQSRLAELRERLGLPSEPAQSRPGGPRPGGAPSATPPPAAVPVQPSAATATLQGLGAPVGPAALPSFAPVPAPEPDAPALVAVPVRPGVEPAPAAGDEGDSTVQPLPALEAAVLGAMVQGTAPPPAEARNDLAPEPFDSGTLDGDASLQALPELAAEDLSPPTDGAALDTLPELTAEGLAPAADGAALDALPELASEDLSPPTDGAALDALPELAADALEAAMPGDAAGQEPSATLPDLAATGSIELLAEAPGPESPLGGIDAGALALDASAEPGQPEDLSPPVAPPRTSLADRIDAAVETLESEPTPGEEQPGWGAVPVDAGTGEAGLPLETELQADLGAIPLDVADPAMDPGFPETAAVIELSSADVVSLDGELQQEPDLGGEPADPVPLAALHEFVGEQPLDPRALAFDDQEEQPTLAPEDLQATSAELATAPHAFHPTPVEAEPAPEPPAPPVPAAPRVSVPRPPPAPPPARAPRPIPLTVEAPPAPTPAAAVATPAPVRRTATPPPPPAPPRAPTLSAARPEPPRRAGFGQSGPFARPPAVLMAPASLDVMDEELGEVPEPQPEPPPPPATDVATGAEVFGGAYLNPTFVEGEHRVVLHTLEGQVRRGTVKDLDLLDAVIPLAQPGRPPEAIAADRVKAIFFMQEPGTAALPSNGRRVRVGFADGRQIVGFSEDVDSGEQGFFLVPADTRTHTARIYVFRAGVQSISAA